MIIKGKFALDRIMSSVWWQKCMFFIYMQLALMVIMWPVLLWWQMPMSVLSPFGNFIFAPFLTCYLACSSIIFMTHLCGVPNGLFFWLLERITEWWVWLVSCHPPGMLITFPKVPAWEIVLLSISGFLMIHYRFFGSYGKRALFLFLYMLIFGLLIYIQ